MSLADLVAILPLLVLAVASVAVLLVTAWSARQHVPGAWTAIGLAAALAALPFAAAAIPRQVTPILRLDRYALFYLGLLFAAALAVAALAVGYLERRGLRQGEFQVLLLLGTLGAAVLVCSSHFASFFLGLELLSVSLYALIAYERTEERPLEAGLKYLILAGASSAFLLFGMAVIYAQTGTLQFTSLPGPASGTGAPLTGSIQLYRPSAAEQDRKLALALDAAGTQSVDTLGLSDGLWRIRISWTANGADYFADEKVVIARKAT